MLNRWIRQLYKGVSWRNPIINLGFLVMDVPDTMLRTLSGRQHLPKYSNRVRSRGVSNQFGGALFQSQGEQMYQMLLRFGKLKEDSQVLEVGCGCGCAAHGLVGNIDRGSYTGMDIDRKSVEACKANEKLTDQNFSFKHVDVFNSQYNPDGVIQADEYIFPIDSSSKDLVFLTSVFTHMLPSSVENYFKEISRVLKPNGRVVATVFLMDKGYEGASIGFPYEYDACRVHQLTYPERAVGYFYEYLSLKAHEFGLEVCVPPEYGNWREVNADGQQKDNNFGQDIVVFKKMVMV